MIFLTINLLLVQPRMLWNDRHLERSQSEARLAVEAGLKVYYERLHNVITVAIDISTTFPLLHKGNSAQYDGYSKLKIHTNKGRTILLRI